MPANYAVKDNDFNKREYVQEPHKYRTEFQRDRDRIVHSKAFRRLEYKTQVFVNHLGDSYRTRLTHSIEVSQIARTVARSLHLNEDLAETLALAHDLGHPPFGHAGERSLNRLMRDYGGFDHNEQTLRVVTVLEERYPDYKGLNLTEATLMGLQKHSRPGGKSHTLESQVVNVCDEIAYNNHDLDDGIESGYLSNEGLLTLDIWKKATDFARQSVPERNSKILVRTAVRWMINYMVTDLIEQVNENLAKFNIKTLDDVLNHDEKSNGKIVTFSREVSREVRLLKRFLFQKLYRHPEVVTMNTRASDIVKRLFTFFCENPGVLPEEFNFKVSASDNTRYRIVADFIAGMTDRFALSWNKKILGLD